MAHGQVVTTNGTKNGKDSECIVFFPHGPQENEALAAEANEDGSWWSAEESRVIKVPTARFPIFRFLDNNCVGREKERERERGKKRGKNKVRESKTPGSAASGG